MKLLNKINELKNEGFSGTKAIELFSEKESVWSIFPNQISIIGIDEKLNLELEDGTEYCIDRYDKFIIPANTFFKVSAKKTYAKYLFASKAA